MCVCVCAHDADNRKVKEDGILIKTNPFLSLTVGPTTSSHHKAAVEGKSVQLSKESFIPDR